jgi:trans-L-3-hydroxyproline dehydratase
MIRGVNGHPLPGASRQPQVVRIRTIDAHVAGAPLRLIVDGFPSLPGRTMAARLAAAGRHDALRRAVMLEPRGHRDMSGAVLTEPERATADAGVVFMHASGFGALCGHGIIATVTIALERELVTLAAGRPEFVLDTATGPVTARFERAADGRVLSVAYAGPPAFVQAAGVLVPVGARSVRVDVACAGEFYAIVDAEGAGVPLDVAHVAELRRVGVAIAVAAGKVVKVQHPENPALSEFAGTVFTGPSDRGDLRSATIYADGALDRSPGGTPTGAVMAVLDAMGLLSEDHVFTHESLIGTALRGRIMSRTLVGEVPAIVPEIEGAAFLTGEHTFLIDRDDPLGEGYEI